MAVPKKKRYKQIVAARRALLNNNLLRKKNIKIDKFTNFMDFSPKVNIKQEVRKLCPYSSVNCGYSVDGISNLLCLYCLNDIKNDNY